MTSTPKGNWTMPEDPHGFQQSTERLSHSIRTDRRISHLAGAPRPDRDQMRELVDRMIALLYPGYFDESPIPVASIDAHVKLAVEDIGLRLSEQVAAALRYEAGIEEDGSTDHDDDTIATLEYMPQEFVERARSLTGQFIESLPSVRNYLSLDVQAAFDGDPAAMHLDEIVLCYPGQRALSVHRLAHELYKLNVPLLPRIMQEDAHSATGIDLHPGAQIGRSFFMDHGTGIVIGESTVIGDHCRIYQGVTLGAKQFEKDEHGHLKRGVKRHPTLEDHVTVYAGATILGGDTVIGAGSVVNGGVFLTSSVPPGHVVRGPRFEITLRSNPDVPPPSYSI